MTDYCAYTYHIHWLVPLITYWIGMAVASLLFVRHRK